MHQHTDALASEIARKAQELRIENLQMVYRMQTGHLGGPFSAPEIVAALYFHQLRIDPQEPDWPECDRFILSKGHAAPILYAGTISSQQPVERSLSKARDPDPRQEVPS